MNNVRVTYPASRERVQVNLRLPVSVKRRLVASALGQNRPIRDEAEELLVLGLDARDRSAAAA